MFGKRSAAVGLGGALAIALEAMARWAHLSLTSVEGDAFSVLIIWAGLWIGGRYFGPKSATPIVVKTTITPALHAAKPKPKPKAAAKPKGA